MAVFVLAWGTGPSAWTTYIVVGAVVAVVGGLLYLVATSLGGAGELTNNLVQILSLVLVVVGVAAIVGGLAVRRWRTDDSPDA